VTAIDGVGQEAVIGLDPTEPMMIDIRVVRSNQSMMTGTVEGQETGSPRSRDVFRGLMRSGKLADPLPLRVSLNIHALMKDQEV
jgi:hypothetical protein